MNSFGTLKQSNLKTAISRERRSYSWRQRSWEAGMLHTSWEYFILLVVLA